MNKQEAIEKIEKGKSNFNAWEDLTRNRALNDALAIVRKLDEPEKPVVPQYVADMIAERKKQKYGIVGTIQNLSLFKKHSKWIIENQEAFVKAWLYGYEVEKEKLYTAKNKQTGEYLCYCFEFFHDKNSSSENQRFTAEEKRWKELGYWDNDLYVFEEVEGEDE